MVGYFLPDQQRSFCRLPRQSSTSSSGSSSSSKNNSKKDNHKQRRRRELPDDPSTVWITRQSIDESKRRCIPCIGCCSRVDTLLAEIVAASSCQNKKTNRDDGAATTAAATEQSAASSTCSSLGCEQQHHVNVMLELFEFEEDGSKLRFHKHVPAAYKGPSAHAADNANFASRQNFQNGDETTVEAFLDFFSSADLMCEDVVRHGKISRCIAHSQRVIPSSKM